MGRALLAVIAGFFTMFLLLFVLFTAAFLAMGAGAAFKPASYETSTTWNILSIFVTLAAAAAGGLVCAKVARTGAPVKVLAALLVAFGLVMAIPTFLATPPKEARPDSMANLDAMQQAQTPPAMAILNGLLNGVGVVLGGRKKLSMKTPRATPGLAAT